MLDTARAMPSDPDLIYHETLKQTDSQALAQARLARKVLAWLVLVRRNVTVEELAEAIAIEIGNKSLNTRLLSSESTMLRVCRGLVVVSRQPNTDSVDQVTPWLADEHVDRSNIIGLAHKTFRDFYLEKATVELTQMKTYICLACTTFLGFDDFCKPKLRDGVNGHVAEASFYKHKFLVYATMFLEEHVQDSGEPSEVITSLFKVFSNPLSAYNFQTGYLLQLFADSHRVNEVLNPTKEFNIRITTGGYSQAPTVLHIGVLIGSSALVHFALEKSKNEYFKNEAFHGVDISGLPHCAPLLEAKDYNGRTALHWCALLERPAIARILVDHGANPNMTDRLNFTIINDAVINQSVETLRLLLDSGSSIESQKYLTRSIWAYGQSYQVLEMLNMLIASGIDINAKSRSGGTVLHEAAGIGFKEAIDFLLANGAYISEDNRGWTPLHNLANTAITFLEPIVRIFLSQGMSINKKTKNGMTALHVAAINCNVGAAMSLVKHGALINAEDEHGRTAIQLVVIMGIPGDHLAASYMVRLLLEYGATPPGTIEDVYTDERPTFASGIQCDHCEARIRTSDCFFNCSVCENGDFDLCQSCVEEGRWCDDSKHTMEKTYVQVEETGPSGVECNHCGLGFWMGYRFSHCNICDNGNFDLCMSCKEYGYHCDDIEHKLENRVLTTIDPFTTECDLCGFEWGMSDVFSCCNVCNLGLCQPCAEKRQYCSCFKNGLQRMILKIRGLKRGSYPVAGYEMGFQNKYGIYYTESTSNAIMVGENGGQDTAVPSIDRGKRAWSERDEMLPDRSKLQGRE